MINSEKPLMLVLSSPSGAGKTTLTKKIQQSDNSFKASVSHTTRKARANEVDGVDYHFVSKERFQKLIEEKAFYEHAKIFDNYYGTSKLSIKKIIDNKQNVLFDIDWQGTEKIKKQKLKFKLITFFILPPSRKILFKRLSNRDMKDKLIASQRMKQFDKDVLHWKNYDYVVINRNLEKCYKKILKIINSKKYNLNIRYNKKTIKKHKKKLI